MTNLPLNPTVPAAPARSPGPLEARALDSPFGTFVVCGDDEAVVRILLPSDRLADRFDVPLASTGRPAAAVAEALGQLAEYFAGRRRTFDLPLRPHYGTAFQRQVWSALADIGYGETISYAELARRVDRPRGFRAVGQANGANPLPVVLPCHRVVASGGGIGGYGGGLTLKRQLLALESGGLEFGGLESRG